MNTTVIVRNLSRTLPAPARVRDCRSFFCRLRGLMFRRRLGRDDGLLLVQPRQNRTDAAIHMLFVPFDLAVIWIDDAGLVVDRVLARAWRPAYIPRAPARYTLEIHPSRFDEYQVGDRVEILPA